MAKLVIILSASETRAGSTVNLAFWFSVSPDRAVPIPGGHSAWTLASSTENAAIADGTVIESLLTIEWAEGTPRRQVRDEIVARYIAGQLEITNRNWVTQHVNAYYDSQTGWSIS